MKRRGRARKNTALTIIGQLLRRSPGDALTLRVAEAVPGGGPLRRGFHNHEGFELFFVHGAAMRFETAGQPPAAIPPGTVLIVPPGLMHMTIQCLPQHPRLREVTFTLDEHSRYNLVRWSGALPDREALLALSPEEMAHWASLLGETPFALIKRICRALSAGAWGRQRALAFMRALLAGAAETLAREPGEAPAPIEQKARATQMAIESGYFEPDLTVRTLAAKVGLSPSHLAASFRRITGSTLHHALLDVRLRRGMDLLVHDRRTVKEAAYLTGWSNQFHFSSAFRQRYGAPPSVFAKTHGA